MPPKISFDLKGLSAAAPASSKLSAQPPAKRALLGGDSSDEDTAGDEVLSEFIQGAAGPSKTNGLTSSGSSPAGIEKKKEIAGQSGTSTRILKKSDRPGVPNAAPASRAARQFQEDALEVDPDVFDYDGAWDRMNAARREKEKEKEVERARRDPKYIANFLASTEQRKLDRLRAESKMMQREREREGDEFADKEAFVTDAYREQMEQLKEEEAKEKAREAADREKSGGVGAFYKSLMNDQLTEHEAAVAASLKNPQSAEAMQAATAAAEEEEAAKRSHAQLAEEARLKGLAVELNDDKELVDQRSILSTGLNIIGRKKRPHGPERSSSAAGASSSKNGANVSDGPSRSAREAQRARQSKLIEDQMIELERKRAREAEEEHEEKRRKIGVGAERRNDDAKVEGARERFLRRKKEKEEKEMEIASAKHKTA